MSSPGFSFAGRMTLSRGTGVLVARGAHARGLQRHLYLSRQVRDLPALANTSGRLSQLTAHTATPVSAQFLASGCGGRRHASSSSDDEPVRFTTSAAYHKHISHVNPPSPDGPPFIQALSVTLSVSLFMLYFCVFREENDVDEYMRNTTLYDHIEGLEKQQLEQALARDGGGKYRDDILARLEELKEEERLREAKRKEETREEASN